MKNTYFIDIKSGEILQNPIEESGHYTVFATDKEIAKLKALFEQNHTAEMETFVRAQTPFKEYHKDKEDKHYDQAMINIYRYLYELGDENTKANIEGIGILGKNELNERSNF
ncbi:hydrolase [Peribacillus alkalitolerans]|uniref:hydrolase n=1 Tax=Peribacillus alkalitolerans TaxID=1550385 RepID=UPI0013D3183C|nr:hydrolase [Peribacillus alkalitolerans]